MARCEGNTMKRRDRANKRVEALVREYYKAAEASVSLSEGVAETTSRTHGRKRETRSVEGSGKKVPALMPLAAMAAAAVLALGVLGFRQPRLWGTGLSLTVDNLVERYDISEKAEEGLLKAADFMQTIINNGG